MIRLLLFSLVSVSISPLPIVVDLRGSSITPQLTFAAQVCSGLFNRISPQSVYILSQDVDVTWLEILAPSLPNPPLNVSTFLTSCLSNTTISTGYIRYSYKQQQLLIGNIATLASVLNAIPIEENSSLLTNSSKLVFDAQINWFNYTALNATSYMFLKYANKTSTLCMMNPGLDVHGNPFNPSPPLSNQPDFSLTDFIVKQKLFTFFLVSACIDGTDEGKLMETMATSGIWPSPITVYGYNDAYPIAGDIFEAETNCVKQHNMGQVATVGVTNLAYLSGATPIEKPLLQNPSNYSVYNKSKTYLTFIIGDGDNIAMVKSSRYDWFNKRLSQCSNNMTVCFPLAWTLSPHLLNVAPEILKWYYLNSYSTGRDYFVLPPSGALYSYPGSMQPEDQAKFVTSTEEDSILMNTSASVSWEWFGTWSAAINSYFPQYAVNKVVRSFYAVNVPYMIPIIEFSLNEFFKVLNDTVILFKPNEWRGTTGGAIIPPLMYNVSQMATFINEWPLGTCSHIYLTSDGGGDLQDFFDLIPYLNEHVQIVDPDALSNLAIQSHTSKS